MIRKLGNSQASEIARRLNANEQKQLQKEIGRYEKEYTKAIKSLLEKRHCAREAMGELQRDFKLTKGKERQDETWLYENVFSQGRVASKTNKVTTLDAKELEKEKKSKILTARYRVPCRGNTSLESHRPRAVSYESAILDRNIRRPLSTPLANREKCSIVSYKRRPITAKSTTRNIDDREGPYENRLVLTKTHDKLLAGEENILAKGPRFRSYSGRPAVTNCHSSQDLDMIIEAGSKKPTNQPRFLRCELEPNHSFRVQKAAVADRGSISPLLKKSAEKCIGVSQEKVGYFHLEREGKAGKNHLSSRFRLSPSTGLASFRQVSNAALAAQALIAKHRREESIRKATIELVAKRHVQTEPSQKSRFVKVANVIIAAKLFRDTLCVDCET